MAKSKLTKQAISFLIDKYECETTTYTFPEIAKMIAEKFGVEVSAQAVGKSYHKNKGSFKDNASKMKTLSNVSANDKPKKEFQRSDNLSQQKASGFNDNAGETLSKDEIKNLLG